MNMNGNYIYLKCNTGSGYFAGIMLTSMGQEVKVHTDKSRAYRFKSKQEAYSLASQLKAKFKCVISYTIL